MSSYNSCATYTLLQSSFRYAKPQLPLGSFNHQNFNHSSMYPTGHSSSSSSSVSKSLPPTTSGSDNGNSQTFNWHYPVKMDGIIARRNCMREPRSKVGTACYPEICTTLVKEESSKYSDDEQNNLSAFLGPNLWEKSSGADFKLEYMDLDEFLVENGIPLDPVNDSVDSTDKSTVSDVSLDSFVQSPDQLAIKVKDEDLNSVSSDSTAYKQEDNDLVPEDDDEDGDVDDDDEDDDDNIDDVDDDEDDDDDDDSNCNSDVFQPPKSERSRVPGKNRFDPAKRKFSSDELKPQPLVKKSKKIFVPFERKDDKYWARRKKNNIAAKRSRDARRVKENQIALRANFLERENQNLREKMAKVLKDMSQTKKEKDTLKSDNDFLRKQLSKYTCQ